MNSKLAVLTLLLNDVGTGTSIDSKEDRLVFQKAVYLMQAKGIKLGYSYSWYINGPYSTSLTRDYYELDELQNQTLVDGRELNPAARQIAQAVCEMVEVPDDVQLSKSRWMELLASVHYSRHELRRDDNKARALIEKDKPLLVPFYDRAVQHLEANQLL
ncbi:hypothetical protein [Parasphingorhabdus cellanae]|uniref:DUF4065 domain-containing protein n=1 Tax=Parasphingorhabdus cellanae TaxID=2806553 RepID=A0ABX7T5T7_9SPHN|nr:hypothetical protein [Parasphingorhabdus cellanae]QTD55482.1 hypothetical protein J4G78_14915 [Parasphingorhabdus cellanae]